MSFPLKALVEPLVAWYELNRKTFPWRENPTPYRVWISEIISLGKRSREKPLLPVAQNVQPILQPTCVEMQME